MIPTAHPPKRDCREEFKETAVAFRKQKRRFVWLYLPLLLSFFLFPAAQRIPFYFVFLMPVAFWIISPEPYKLDCPACKASIDKSSGDFCPECGSDQLVKRGLLDLRMTRCQSCGKKLSVGESGRNYKVRYCRSCGAYLDTEGL